MSISTLLTELETNKVNYDFIIEHLKLNPIKLDSALINVVIPVMGRKEFLPILHKSLLNAIDKVQLPIIVTVVEISDEPEHDKYCNMVDINYCWLDINLLTKADHVFNSGFNGVKLFNKSLAMNIGAIISPKTDYLLFHDLDCLVQSDFFSRLLLNVELKKAKALQCFQLRRVLYMNDTVTNRILINEINVDDLSINTDGISLPIAFGAPGGSIMVESEIFFNVRGYDPELFSGYSTEDAFFWDKLSSVCEIHSSDNPAIDIFHMYHTPAYNTNPLFNKMHGYLELFNGLTTSERLEFINNKTIIKKKNTR